MVVKARKKRRAKGEGALIKRRGHYYLRRKIENKHVELPLKNADGSLCTSAAQAKSALEQMDQTLLELDTQEKIVSKVAEIRQLKVVHQAQSSDVWKLYINSANRPDTGAKSLAEQQRLFERFGNWMHTHYHCGVDGTTPVAASEFMHEIGEQVSNRTFDGYAATLRLVFKTVYRQLGMTENPFENIRHRPLETISRREFTAEQVQKIFDGFKDGFFYETEVEGLGPGRTRLREIKRLEYKPLYKEEMEVLMKLCCFSGCDGQSGCLMKWENIDFDKNQINYVRLKTRKKRNAHVISLPMHPTLRDALLSAMEWREPDSPYILPNVARRYQRNRSGVQQDAMKIFRCALGVETTTHDTDGTRRSIGANVYSLHSFRHTFVSICANAGVPLAIVAEIVGHGNPAMTRHYTHVNDTAKEKAIEVLPSFGQVCNAVDETVALPATVIEVCEDKHIALSSDSGNEGRAADENTPIREHIVSFLNGASRMELASISQFTHRLWHLRNAV